MKKAIILVAFVLCLGAFGYLFLHSDNKQELEPAAQETEGEAEQEALMDGFPEEEGPLPEDYHPVITETGRAGEAITLSQDRLDYESGDLTLRIPKLSVSAKVQNGTTTEDLRHGPCLYEYAALPGDEGGNVSIAAHRNYQKNGKISEALFYYIDTLTDGDYAYLTDGKTIYRYVYRSTIIVKPTDWGPIYPQGYACLTLTSCEPIGYSTYRMVVQLELDETFPYSDAFSYEAVRK